MEDLSGREFGFLKVIERAEDHVTKSGQRKVTWLCECQLCGKSKLASSQDLKNGRVSSCGCYREYKGGLVRNKKICVICGKEFDCPPSNKVSTCSPACRSEHVRRRRTGKAFSEATLKKLSLNAQGRDMSALQELALEGAKNSPKSGRFITNINAIDWHLISPDGKHYKFHSLSFWLRENCIQLFGCQPDSLDFFRIDGGLRQAKRGMLGTSACCCTYKDWRVIPTDDDFNRLTDNIKPKGNASGSTPSE